MSLLLCFERGVRAVWSERVGGVMSRRVKNGGAKGSVMWERD